MRHSLPRGIVNRLALLGLCLLSITCSKTTTGPQFVVSLPPSAAGQPITGRVFVMISREETPEPRLQAGAWERSVPFFGLDVEQLKSGQSAMIDGKTWGYPVEYLNQIPAGDYYVQALLNVYNEFKRSDGHTLWLHEDHWEGQS